MLTGIRKPDAGTIAFNGEPAPPFGAPGEWQKHVACVYQHSTIIPDLSVGENLFLNRQPGRAGFISWRNLTREADLLLQRWGVDVPVDRRAGDLTVEERQLVEIARSLSRGARFVILDEPTAQLDGKEIRRLFARLGDLQRDGITFLFISHHLQEVYEICDRVTVLRDARHIVTTDVARLPKHDLIAAMTGETAHARLDNPRLAPTGRTAPLIDIQALGSRSFSDVTLLLRRGEIVGLAGASSSGRTELAEAIAGLTSFDHGTINVDGRPLPSGDVVAALAAGIGCVPKNRHHQGLVLGETIADNVIMPVMGTLGPGGFISPARKHAAGRQAIAQFGIVASGTEHDVAQLSGGNQQKVVFGRAVASDPSALVLIDPTAGVDVRSKEALLTRAEDMRDAGKAILLSSAEPDDLRICDRVLVMRHGRIVAEFASGWDEADLVAAIEGLES
jgi:simple sugar transport system ATP-binding protein